MKKIFFVFLLFVFLASPAIAANTVNDTGTVGRVVEVSGIDSNFDLVARAGYTQYATAGGAPLEMVLFFPGAANDILVIRDTVADTGPIIAKMKSLDGEPRIMYFRGAKVKPVMDYSDCTLSSGALVIFILAPPK